MNHQYNKAMSFLSRIISLFCAKKIPDDSKLQSKFASELRLEIELFLKPLLKDVAYDITRKLNSMNHSLTLSEEFENGYLNIKYMHKPFGMSSDLE
jgi:hypothetical protein